MSKPVLANEVRIPVPSTEPISSLPACDRERAQRLPGKTVDADSAGREEASLGAPLKTLDKFPTGSVDLDGSRKNRNGTPIVDVQETSTTPLRAERVERVLPSDKSCLTKEELPKKEDEALDPQTTPSYRARLQLHSREMARALAKLSASLKASLETTPARLESLSTGLASLARSVTESLSRMVCGLLDGVGEFFAEAGAMGPAMYEGISACYYISSAKPAALNTNTALPATDWNANYIGAVLAPERIEDKKANSLLKAIDSAMASIAEASSQKTKRHEDLVQEDHRRAVAGELRRVLAEHPEIRFTETIANIQTRFLADVPGADLPIEEILKRAHEELKNRTAPKGLPA